MVYLLQNKIKQYLRINFIMQAKINHFYKTNSIQISVYKTARIFFFYYFHNSSLPEYNLWKSSNVPTQTTKYLFFL